MLNRFLPLAAPICVSDTLGACQAQQGAAGDVRGRIVDSVTGRTADVRVELRRAAAIDFALVRGRDTAGAGNPTSSGRRALFTRSSRSLHAAFTLNGRRIHARWAFMATTPGAMRRSA